jgi:hypothetical protein
MAETIAVYPKVPDEPYDPTFCPTCLSGFEPPLEEYEEATRDASA